MLGKATEKRHHLSWALKEQVGRAGHAGQSVTTVVGGRGSRAFLLENTILHLLLMENSPQEAQ